MIIWDREDLWGPDKEEKCTFCFGRLRPPFVMWRAAGHEVYICNGCCARTSGLSLDMGQLATARQIRRLGFHKARPSAGATLIEEGGNA